MKHYIDSQIKMNKLAIDPKMTADELHRFSLSDCRWADGKFTHFQTRKVYQGDIYQFEFGKNYFPEMSYEHRGLVLRVNKKLLYVVPIYSYDSAKQTDVYHPVDSPASKSDLYLLKTSEHNFITHDSVVKMNDLRTVSINRILYQQKNGHIDIQSQVFTEIQQMVFAKYFPSYWTEYNRRQEEIDRLNAAIQTLQAELSQKEQELGLIKQTSDSRM